ncbi:MAG: hypothetical protein FWF01_03465 [Alphaproteobacteria bacterium]|nr:hypothetical protein [Alphaproteobacteria bacterium]
MMVLPTSHSFTKALVGFTDSRMDRWPLNKLAPGFSHCFICLYFPDLDLWAHAEAASDATCIALSMGTPAAPPPARFLRINRIPYPTLPGRPPGLRVRLYCCTELVKQILGIDAPWVITPRQLYRHLLKHRLIYALSSEGSGRRAAGRRTART